MPKPARRQMPRREKLFGEVVAFHCTRLMREDIEFMRKAMGCSLGEFMRFLVKQEFKGFRIKIVPPSTSTST